MNIATQAGMSGKTSAMLYAALQEAGKGTTVAVVCANTRETLRLKHMAREMCLPLSVPRTISFYSRRSELVRMDEGPRIIGLPFDTKIFTDHYVWEQEWGINR